MPIYTHDCSKCKFLATVICEDYSIDGSKGFDLYYCESQKPTVIVRFGNKPESCFVGWHRSTNRMLIFAKSLVNKKST